jgi:hypothetical protein
MVAMGSLLRIVMKEVRANLDGSILNVIRGTSLWVVGSGLEEAIAVPIEVPAVDEGTGMSVAVPTGAPSEVTGNAEAVPTGFSEGTG